MSVTAFQCERDTMLFYRFIFEQRIADFFSAVHNIFNIVTDVIPLTNTERNFHFSGNTI